MAWVEIIILVGVLGYLFYRWSTKNYKTFEERGIPFQKPLPLLGNALPFVLNKQSLHKIMLNLYREQKHNKIYGFYNFRNPFFIVNDPELIKKIGIKDFDHFTNHQKVFNAEDHPLLREMLTTMRDQRWKDMRNTLTPVFTGAKMRSMFTLMNECFQETMNNLHSKQESGKDSFEVELKDCFNRLSNDLIATTAFGLKVNSFKDKQNEFFTIGQAITQPKGKQAMKFMLFSMSPQLFKLFGLQLFKPSETNYFIRLVVEAMQYREAHKIYRPDMIQLLMEAKRESKHHWSDEDIVAQCFIFFFAAFENNANLLCTTCYELADNPDIQQKLYEEIMEVDNKLDGKTLDYDVLQEMKYLDMIVQESLRKWTLAAMTDRLCEKDYRVTDEDGKFICDLKEGDRVWFQIIGLHRDEKYFEHPEVFDPERFNDENKHKIKPCTYLPFGVGPRICIGNRYALMQAKAMLYYLLKEFIVERSPKLCEDLMEDIRGFVIVPQSGFWFKLTKRKQTSEL